MDAYLLALALGLPQSPLGAAVFILVALAITYAILTVFIQTRPVTPVEEYGEEQDADEVAPAEEPAYLSDAAEEGGPAAGADVPPLAKSAPARAEPDDLRVEAVVLRGNRIAIGDPASQVMRAIRRSEAGMLPLIDRDEAGRAGHVTRQYMVNGRRLVLVFTRPADEDALRLTGIGLEKP